MWPGGSRTVWWTRLTSEPRRTWSRTYWLSAAWNALTCTLGSAARLVTATWHSQSSPASKWTSTVSHFIHSSTVSFIFRKKKNLKAFRIRKVSKVVAPQASAPSPTLSPGQTIPFRQIRTHYTPTHSNEWLIIALPRANSCASGNAALEIFCFSHFPYFDERSDATFYPKVVRAALYTFSFGSDSIRP